MQSRITYPLNHSIPEGLWQQLSPSMLIRVLAVQPSDGFEVQSLYTLCIWAHKHSPHSLLLQGCQLVAGDAKLAAAEVHGKVAVVVLKGLGLLKAQGVGAVLL